MSPQAWFGPDLEPGLDGTQARARRFLGPVVGAEQRRSGPLAHGRDGGIRQGPVRLEGR